MKRQMLIVAIRNFVREENGASMVEYGLLLVLIAVVSVVVISSLSPSFIGMFTQVTVGF